MDALHALPLQSTAETGLKMFCQRIMNCHHTGEGDKHSFNTQGGEKNRMPLNGESRAVSMCIVTAEQETHQP